MKNSKIIDQIKDLILLTGGTLGEILNMSSDDIEPAESGETIIDIESARIDVCSSFLLPIISIFHNTVRAK